MKELNKKMIDKSFRGDYSINNINHTKPVGNTEYKLSKMIKGGQDHVRH
jgi:hypothetical protein